MRLKLNKEWQEKLLILPELGMGYQIIDITLKDGRKIKKVKIFNAEILELPKEYRNISEKDIIRIELSKQN